MHGYIFRIYIYIKIIYLQTRMHKVACRRRPVDHGDRTDREIFESLKLTDTWDDADLFTVFSYLWNSKSTSIPDSWLTTMVNFEKEFKEKTIGPNGLVAEYNAARMYTN